MQQVLFGCVVFYHWISLSVLVDETPHRIFFTGTRVPYDCLPCDDDCASLCSDRFVTKTTPNNMTTDDFAVARQFYAVALVGMYTVWAVLSIALKRDFYAANAGRKSVLLRPSWLASTDLLRWLHGPVVRPIVCHLPGVALSLAWWHAEDMLCRVGAAAALSVYSLVDSSATHSHRDYGNLYCAWLLAVCPPAVAQAGALGVCVHYITSSGLAKLVIAGSARAWSSPDTLGGVLQAYGKVLVLTFGLGEKNVLFSCWWIRAFVCFRAFVVLSWMDSWIRVLS